MISNDVRPARRAPVAGDVARGFGAVVALAALVVGVPLVLLRWGHWPITGLPSWDQVTDLPTTLVSDSTVLGIFTVALWLAWAVFTLAVLAEAAAQVQGRRRAGLPTSSPIQRLAGHLVATVMVAFGSFASLSAASVPTLPASAAGGSMTRAARPEAQAVVMDDRASELGFPLLFRESPTAEGAAVDNGAQAEPGPADAAPPAVGAPASVAGAEAEPALVPLVITVERGDSPWGLAEAHLGDGMRWRELWEFNRARPQPDGGVWANPDDAIRPAWLLAIPGTSVAPGPVSAAGVVVPSATAMPAEDVVVEPGDDFWELAEGQLGEAWGRQPTDAEVARYWKDTLDVNAARLRPPRDADDIYPGEQFVLPATPADPLAPAPPATPPPTSPPPNGTVEGPGPADTGSAGAAATATPDAAAPAPEAEVAPSPPADQAAPATSDIVPPATTPGDSAPADQAAPAPAPQATAPAPEGSAPVAGDEQREPTATAAPESASDPAAPEAAAPEVAPTTTAATAAPAPPAPEGEAAPDAAAASDAAVVPEAVREPGLVPPSTAAPDEPATGAETPPAAAPPAATATTAPPATTPAPPPAPEAGQQAPVDEAPAVTDTPDTPGATEGPALPSEDVTGPVEQPAPTAESDGLAAEDDGDAGDDGGSTVPVGLVGGGLALAGLVLLLDRRRRAQNRHRRSGRRVAMPNEGLAAVEHRLRAGTDTEAARRVDAALRAAAAGSGVGGPPELRWVESTPAHVTLVVSPAAPPPAGFADDGSGRWRTTGTADELAALGASAASLAPALVPLGTTEDGTEVLVDLEASGVLSVSGPEARVEPFLRSLALAAATAPWTGHPRVLLVGLGGEMTALPWVETAGTLGMALVDAENRAAEAVSALRGLQCQTTAQARAAGTTPDAWEPLVVVSSRAPHDERYRVAALAARPGHAVAVVCPPGDAVHGRRLDIDDDGWMTLADCDLRIRARQLDGDDTRAVVELLDLAADLDGVPVTQAEEPEVRTPAPLDPDEFDDEAFGAGATAGRRPGSGPEPAASEDAPPDDLDDVAPDAESGDQSEHAEHHDHGDRLAAPVPIGGDDRPSERLADLLADVDVLVKVLGDVEVVRFTDDGSEERVVPGRQKALEAMAYLALREVPVDREDLEIVLFPTGANATKTFHNTVAAARRSLGDDLFPAPTGGRYELAEGVVTDYGLFHELVASAEDIDDAERAADVLSEALSLVGGEPFVGAGRGYAWVAPHRGMIVAQVVDVAEEVAEIRLATGDWRSAEWAARQGLRAFPCDERMYRLLMRAAHAAGNMPGVQRVFRELCDTVADPDDGAEPEDTIHPETLALLDTLTGGHGRTQASA
jgi:DNA-binding SARP family transcriptional activator